MSESPKMTYVRVGSSGLKVSKIILGCMTYGNPDWQPWVLDEEIGIAQIKYAYEAGINTFDTADIYSNGVSEEILGKAIKTLELPRDNIVVLTKVCGAVGRGSALVYATPDFNLDDHGYTNQYGLSRKHIFAGVKASLARLGLEYIDVLQCHRFDTETPITETMQALHDVVQAGLVRYIGMSSCYAYQFHAMQNYAIQNKLTPFISMQNHYNLVYREEEREMMPTLKMFGVGSIPWSPIARGLLARPYGVRSKRADTDFFYDGYSKDSEGVVKRVQELAEKRGVSMAQIALSWTMNKEGVTAPIVGTSSLANLKDLIGAINVKLTEEEVKYLEELYPAQGIFQHIQDHS